jgi:hypothetical protein
VISLCAQYAPGGIEFHVIDLSAANTAWSGVFGHLAEGMPHSFRVVGRRGTGEVLDSVKALLKERSDLEDLEGQEAPLVFLVIAGLHRARKLRRTDRYTQSDLGTALSGICAEGPEFDVHTVIWSNTHTSLENVFERDQIAEFDLRVAMQMSQDESSAFLGSVEASNLGKDRAYFFDEDTSPKPERFRPYALVTREDIADMAAGLKSRA